MICVSKYKNVLTLVLLSIVIQQRKFFTESRAIMVEPPHRSSLWRFNYNTTMNLRDDSLNCGGYDWQWGVHGGRCGVCGDLWNGTQDNADKGRYDSGIIVRQYIDGHYINITFEVSSNYLGYVEFKLCPRNSTDQVLEQSCFDRYPLWIDESHGTRYYIGSRGGIYDIHIRLSSGLVCKKCVLQWKYKTGYRYNGDDQCKCLGCGKQEQYINCADIEIAPADGWPQESRPVSTPAVSRPIPAQAGSRAGPIQPSTTGRKDQATFSGASDGTVASRPVDKIQDSTIRSSEAVPIGSFINRTSQTLPQGVAPPSAISQNILQGLLPPSAMYDFTNLKNNLNMTFLETSTTSNVTETSSNKSVNISTDNRIGVTPSTDMLQKYVTPLAPTAISPPSVSRTTPRQFIGGGQSIRRNAITLEDLRRSIIGNEIKSGGTLFFSPPKNIGRVRPALPVQPVRPVTNAPLRPPSVVQRGQFQVAPSRSTVPNTHFPSVSNILNRFYMTPFLFPGSNMNLPPGCNVFSDEFRCKARGIYNQSPGISKWCEINCRASNCVSFMCECSCEDKMKNNTSKCHAIADFHGVEGMDLWCVANCKVGFCPANTCSVEDCLKSSNIEV